MGKTVEQSWKDVDRFYRRAVVLSGDSFIGILKVIQYLKKTGATDRLYGSTSHTLLNIAPTSNYSSTSNSIRVSGEEESLELSFFDGRAQEYVEHVSVHMDQFQEPLDRFLALL